jgi:histone deacetylase complex regulatory component SIN3
METKSTINFCVKCGATYKVLESQLESGSSYGRPDLCWDCAARTAKANGCTHIWEDCTCALEEATSTWVVIILVKRDLSEIIWDSYAYVQRNCTKQEAENAARSHFTPSCFIKIKTQEIGHETHHALLDGPTVYGIYGVSNT